MSDRVMGRIIETGPTRSIFSVPRHPYTQALLSAVPTPDPTQRGKRKRIVLAGELPSQANPPSGCGFRTRCWKATEKCARVAPLLATQPDGLLSACHYPGVAYS